MNILTIHLHFIELRFTPYVTRSGLACRGFFNGLGNSGIRCEASKYTATRFDSLRVHNDIAVMQLEPRKPCGGEAYRMSLAIRSRVQCAVAVVTSCTYRFFKTNGILSMDSLKLVSESHKVGNQATGTYVEWSTEISNSVGFRGGIVTPVFETLRI